MKNGMNAEVIPAARSEFLRREATQQPGLPGPAVVSGHAEQNPDRPVEIQIFLIRIQRLRNPFPGIRFQLAVKRFAVGGRKIEARPGGIRRVPLRVPEFNRMAPAGDRLSVLRQRGLQIAAVRRECGPVRLKQLQLRLQPVGRGFEPVLVDPPARHRFNLRTGIQQGNQIFPEQLVDDQHPPASAAVHQEDGYDEQRENGSRNRQQEAAAAPLAAATLVIESIERFDAPKTAITTILAGVVAGAIASTIFPINPYHDIQAIVPDLPIGLHLKLYLLFAVIVSVFGKFYSLLMLYAKRMYPAIRQPEYIKLLGLLGMAYIISLTVTDLTGGGEQFLMQQAEGGNSNIYWIAGMMFLHMVFTVFSFSSGLPGGSFIPTLVTGGLIGKLYALVLVQHGIIGMASVSYVMLIGMGAFLVAVVRTPITAIILITEITGHFEVFYPSIVVGGLTYYFTELLEIKPFNVMFYEEMINKPVFREQKRLTLDVEVMAGAYFDSKEVDTLKLPNHCVIMNIHRDRKDISPTGQTILPGDQLTIELDAQDIEKLYEPLVSMANIY